MLHIGWHVHKLLRGLLQSNIVKSFKASQAELPLELQGVLHAQHLQYHARECRAF